MNRKNENKTVTVASRGVTETSRWSGLGGDLIEKRVTVDQIGEKFAERAETLEFTSREIKFCRGLGRGLAAAFLAGVAAGPKTNSKGKSSYHVGLLPRVYCGAASATGIKTYRDVQEGTPNRLDQILKGLEQAELVQRGGYNTLSLYHGGRGPSGDTRKAIDELIGMME